MRTAVPKGCQDRAREQLDGLSYTLNQVIVESKGNFKPEIEDNFKKIIEYFKESAKDLYKENLVKKYYTGEKPTKDIPINKLVVVRYSGPDEYVTHLNTCNVYYDRERKEGSVFVEPGISLGAKICKNAPKFIGYSDGIMFHILKKDCMYADGKNWTLEKDFFERYLKDNNVRYTYIIKDSPRGYSYLYYSREAGVVPVYRLDSYCEKFQIDPDMAEIHQHFIDEFSINI